MSKLVVVTDTVPPKLTGRLVIRYLKYEQAYMLVMSHGEFGNDMGASASPC